jgi:hypothetical protein
VLGELVVKGLGVLGPQPQRHAEAGCSTVEIGSGQGLSDRIVGVGNSVVDDLSYRERRVRVQFLAPCAPW